MTVPPIHVKYDLDTIRLDRHYLVHIEIHSVLEIVTQRLVCVCSFILQSNRQSTQQMRFEKVFKRNSRNSIDILYKGTVTVYVLKFYIFVFVSRNEWVCLETHTHTNYCNIKNSPGYFNVVLFIAFFFYCHKNSRFELQRNDRNIHFHNLFSYPFNPVRKQTSHNGFIAHIQRQGIENCLRDLQKNGKVCLDELGILHGYVRFIYEDISRIKSI